ncbi:MAG TPA: bifunctional (p)ppGpp synthetase/guanosine-3',5'-bis(diphosphate) 3'-pyrophosphohydrolase [Burkholderiales bacterium]|nr:bifunctional (p)ppGpp synthetase/guanosine-3',5'-bis(diphosphate) 3'-pyrophosphohydrolase [Burkholderiales bacterium]
MQAAASALFKDWSGYLKPEDISQLESAFHFSEQAHEGQFRQSGEPYISHPLAVASILAEWHLDSQALTAALLHDVMEDTSITKTEISRNFGRPVAELVDGVSKLDKIEFESQAEAQAENFRKMLLAMARDVRVILIKLADRLHNMRTLDAVAPEKRRRIARETLDIYAPIANRLGLNSIYQELEDLALKHLYPDRFRVLAKAVKSARGNRREVVGKVLDGIKKKLKSAGVEAQALGREKHLHSIYRKMREKHLTFAQVLDVYGFRIIVKDVPSCYLALGALHSLYKPIPGKFKDYLAIPKANGYQSLHTTLFGPFGTPIEVQIRTQEMHKIAEAGVASHWLYKDADTSLSDLQKKTHQWLQSLLEIQSQSGDSAEFLEHLKVDLFPDEVYVFTPKGRILSLPRGATAVDFAYAVHTDIGNRCVAVKINQELMPLRTELKNGDRVEIITAAHAKPNALWLNFVATGKARSRIRHFLKTMHFQESVKLGERLLNQALAALGAAPAEIKEGHWDKFVPDAGAKSRQEILADVGLGKRLAAVVARKLLSRGDPGPHETPAPGSVIIHGSEGMAVQFAPCCRPIPGDPIIGVISKGQGMVIHTHDCPVIAKARHDPDRVLDVAWGAETRKLFEVNIKLVVANQRGVLAKVAAEIAEAGSNIQNVAVDPEDGSSYTNMFFTLQVANRLHLAGIMRALRRIPEVVRIVRVKG